MLENLLRRFRKRRDDEAVDRAIEEEQMTPDERRRTGESIDDLQADNLAQLESQAGTSMQHFDDDPDAPRR